MENIYKIAIPFIKKWEGFVPFYACSADRPTAGYGIRVDLRPDKLFGGITGADLTEEFEKIYAKHKGNLRAINKELEKKYPNLITEEEAEQDLYDALKYDYWEHFGSDLPHGLTDNQCAALLSFVYNVGITNFKRSTMFKYLKKGDFQRAGLEFKKWVYAGGKRLRGLVNRRADEEKLYYS